jgi:hypothetical protein
MPSKAHALKPLPAFEFPTFLKTFLPKEAVPSQAFRFLAGCLQDFYRQPYPRSLTFLET